MSAPTSAPAHAPATKPHKSVRTESASSSQAESSTKKRKKTKKVRSKSKANPAPDADNTQNLFSTTELNGLGLNSDQIESAMTTQAAQDARASSNSSKRRKKTHESSPPPPPGPKTEEGEIAEEVGNSFEDNEDFIAFAPEPKEIPPPIPAEPEPVSSAKGNGTSRDDSRRDRGASRKRSRSRSRSPSRRDRDHSDRWGRGYDSSASKRTPWCDGLDLRSCKNVAELFHQEVHAFTNYMSPTRAEDEVRGMVVALIQDAIQQAFTDAEVLPFGSFSTKLYLPSGDIDLVIFSQSMQVSSKLAVLQSLAATLKNYGITNKVQIIAKAKIPIVKFVTCSDLGRFNVDISVNQGNGLNALKIIKSFLGKEEEEGMGIALRALVLVTKQFLSQRSMNEVFTGGLGSYSIVCLAISFLQMHPKIRSGHIDPSKNLGVLVIEFFELYGVYFNYEDVGISLQDGGSYFRKRERGWFDFYNSRKLCIEDPADDTNDIAAGSYASHKVRTTLAGAHGILAAKAYITAGVLGSRRNGSHIRFHHSYPTSRNDEVSVLSAIVGVPQEMINHRRIVQEIWEGGEVHRWLGRAPPGKGDQVVFKDGAVKAVKSGHEKITFEEEYGVVEEEEDGGGEKDEERSGVEDEPKRATEEGEEKGRYSISSKRRKVDDQKNVSTVYVTNSSAESDSDTGDELVLNIIDEARKDVEVSEEEGEIESPERKEVAAEKEEKVQTRRDFWLSKGVGPGATGSETEED